MRRSHALVVLLLMLAVACTSGPAADAGKHQLALRKQAVVDQQGLGMEVFRMLVPKDWNFQGATNWNFSKFPPEALAYYRVTSPDGRATIEQLPLMNFYWAADPMLQQSAAQSGMSIMQPMDAAGFLKNLYMSHARPDAAGVKVLESQAMPELAQHALEISQFTINVFGQISPFRFPYEQRADSARMKVEYTQGGRKMVEDVTATIDYFIASMGSMFAGAVQTVSWSVTVVSFRAPAEEFDQRAPVYKIVLATRWDNPQWNLDCTRLMAIVTRDHLRQQEAIFQRMQQIHRTLEETSDMMFEGYQRRSAAYDRIFDNYIQGLRGVETYNDPVNKWKVELPTGYDNAWTNGIDYVVSDNANFDPNVGSTQNWQKMSRQR
jgi:hypothetical protein